MNDTTVLRLYDYLDSGNGYKVRLCLGQLAIAYELIEVDILEGGSRTPEFLAKNPNGRIPLLEFEDGRTLAESGAILCFLADGTPLFPSDRWSRAQTLQWMFFEQYSHEPYIATSRFWLRHREPSAERERLLADRRRGGEAALAVMETHLATNDWFAAGRYTIADIALYAYTHVANEGGFDLSACPAVGRWLARVASQPAYKPITAR